MGSPSTRGTRLTGGSGCAPAWEWNAGHIDGALHITGADLPRRIHEVPKDRPLAAICGSGYRSSVAASLLLQDGHKQVYNVLGGMTGWKAAGLPVTKK
jgi:hydroxyacylglutathione hydrolase